MENIFNKVGYTISHQKNSEQDVVQDVLFIKNPNGSIRWIWNANNLEPLFLKFYNVGGIRAKIFTKAVKIIFMLKVQKIVFNKKSYYFKKQENSFFDCTDNWALFTGTIGVNNKAILYTDGSFFKVATTANSKKLIRSEHKILSNLDFDFFQIPKSKQISEHVIQLSDITSGGKRTKKIEIAHLKALTEMNFKGRDLIQIKDWKLFNQLKFDFNQITDERIPKNMMRKISMLLNTISQDDYINVSLSHGDFTSWNMFENKEKISLYDWELFAFDRSTGFDYFHFIIQQGILVDRKSWKEIYIDIKEQCSGESASFLFNYDLEILNKYLKFYLLINCMSYLRIYSFQPKWHVQVDWLLEVWNDALNNFVIKEKTARELVIMDVFDALQNHKYATIKFPNAYPDLLSTNSDIDVLINKGLSESIFKLVKNHSLVAKVSQNRKSFMRTLQLVMVDGSILSIDLIWELKRRNIVFMNAKKALENVCINSFGVKSLSFLDTQSYLNAFYILNNSIVPEKYKIYEGQGVYQMIKNDGNQDVQDVCLNKTDLLKQLQNKRENKGIYYLKNLFYYLCDTIFRGFSKGYVITFSGVDGAGKSTIIENVKIMVEKQLRKPVIVLRHRPSVLPIISVLFRGKNAQKSFENTLPHSGTNKSLLSSLIRFVYYYADYFFGQFFILLKYTIRGYVVIYDRYYFDFIEDSKRSNLVLSKKISFLGYKLLLKPKFNFFLFADSATILSRKKELDEEVINELTVNYCSLFEKLNKPGTGTVYKTIENKEIDQTLNIVLQTLIK
jgi:thymidylate kinase